MLPLLMSIHERVRNSRAVIRVRARLRRGEEVLHTHTHRRRRIITWNTQGPRSSEIVQSKYIPLDVCQILSSVQYQQ